MNNKGFTLVELAIVIVIIGLLVGGVLQGQELIKQAQIRKVVTTFSEFDAALNTFRAKFNGMPGDFSNASNFALNYPNMDSTGTADLADTGQTSENGDGDGQLEDADASGQAEFEGEIANFWVMLANAGMVKGSYTQTSNCTNGGGTACTLTPIAAYPEPPIGVGVLALTEGARLYYVIGTGNNLSAMSAATGAAAATSVRGDNLTPEEAYAIDQKIDNAEPESGVAQVIEGYSTAGVFDVTITGGAATCHSTTPFTYNFNLGTKVCTMRVRASG